MKQNLKALRTATGLMMVLLLVAGIAAAQSATAGAISGTVTDQTGAVVPNAKVTVTSNATNAVSETVAGVNGEFRVSNLSPGKYSVTVNAANFGAYKAATLVEVGLSTRVDARLSVSAAGEIVQVVDEAPLVNTEHHDFSTNVNQTSINELPINGRRWSNFALLTPGATPDGDFGLISFRGISGLLNNNTIDGGDNNQAFFSEERGRTRASYVISQSAVREFQVNTSNYSAEYGRSAGGVVNAVTKSGSNQFHGSAFWYIRDN